jgi:AcrR family transcriptional regulator
MPARVGLTRAAVVEAAAALLDAAEGREVTLADLAAHLGVRTPSLYNHIAGQEALRRELALLGLRELVQRIGRAAIGKAGGDAIIAIGHAYRAFAKERPGLYAATLRAPDPGDHALVAASEEVLAVIRAVLEPFQLGEEETIHAIRALRSLAHGFVSLETGGAFGMPVDIDESYRQLLAMYLDGLHHRTGSVT